MTINILKVGAWRQQAIKVLQMGWEFEEYAGTTHRNDGLIIPGGTTEEIVAYIQRHGLGEDIAQFGNSGKPVLGVCAGMVVLGETCDPPVEGLLGLLPIHCKRHSWGREEFDTTIRADWHRRGGFAAHFSDAPVADWNKSNTRETDEYLLWANEIVAVRKGNIWGCAFETNDQDFYWKVFGKEEKQP